MCNTTPDGPARGFTLAVRSKGLFERLELSYVPGPGCPEPFYLGLGFRHTGRVDGKEVVLELPLGENAA